MNDNKCVDEIKLRCAVVYGAVRDEIFGHIALYPDRIEIRALFRKAVIYAADVTSLIPCRFRLGKGIAIKCRLPDVPDDLRFFTRDRDLILRQMCEWYGVEYTTESELYDESVARAAKKPWCDSAISTGCYAAGLGYMLAIDFSADQCLGMASMNLDVCGAFLYVIMMVVMGNLSYFVLRGLRKKVSLLRKQLDNNYNVLVFLASGCADLVMIMYSVLLILGGKAHELVVSLGHYIPSIAIVSVVSSMAIRSMHRVES